MVGQQGRAGRMLPRNRVDPISYLQGIPEFSGRRGEVIGIVRAVDAIIPMLGDTISSS